MSHNITVEGGTSVRLPTAGKYCDRDIVITAEGGKEDLDAVLTEQEELIATLQETLKGKASGGGDVEITLQTKTVTPTKSVQEITADAEYTALEKVTVEAIPSEYIVPLGMLHAYENGQYDVTKYDKVEVDVVSFPIIEPLEVTENGTYTAPNGVDGYSPITVNVPTGGGEIKPDPSKEYQRIEYIESTTACRIDTDIFADNETGMELLAKYPTLADRVAMGSRLDGNATRFYAPYPLSTNSFYYGFNSGVTKSTGAVANTLYRSSLNFLNDRVSTVKEEDTNVAEFADILTSTLSQQTAPIGIFCYLRMTNGATTLQSSRDMIFYGARISQGREIVREYIPCYRKSDGEIGLYEKYTDQFLVNTGSGTFTKGDDVEW